MNTKLKFYFPNLLKPFRNEKLYNRNKKAVEGRKGKLFKFYETKLYRNMREEISEHLGKKSGDILTHRQIFAMWTACIIEQASNEDSPWCAVYRQFH